MSRLIEFKSAWFLAMMLIVMGCQRDDEVPFEEPPSVKRMVVTAEDIPDVKNTLLQKIGITSEARLFSSNNGDKATELSIDWDHIKQLVDTTGRETYVFGIDDTDPDPHVFYNLVIRYSDNKEAHQPFLLRYKMDEDFFSEYVRTNSLENFRGTTQKIPINGTSDTPERSRAFLDGDVGGIDVGEPCPEENPVNGGGGNDLGGGSGPTYECSQYLVTTTWYSQTCTRSGCEPPVEIGQEQSIVTECGWVNENSAAVGNDNCNPETGEIPIVRRTETRCDDDPLALMMITDYNSSKNANRFGCVRTWPVTSCAPNKKAHNGIDLVAAIGTDVYAMYNGTVYATGTQTNSAGEEIGWGNWVMLKSTINGKDYLNVYAHLDELPTVSGTVTAGTIIGSSGDSGNAEGEPHLHVELREFKSGTSYNNSVKVDPENFLGATFDADGNTNWDVTCD